MQSPPLFTELYELTMAYSYLKMGLAGNEAAFHGFFRRNPFEGGYVVDSQNDFLPGGALAVSHGDEVIQVANRLMREFPLVVASQDWHPPDHASLAVNHPGRKTGDVINLGGQAQVLWSPHYLQGTRGAELAGTLDRRAIERRYRKGVNPGIDRYSALFDNMHRRSTGMAEYLRKRLGEPLFILGMATDFCVKFTALGAVALGFETVVIEVGCRGVDHVPGDSERALLEMQAAGVRLAGRDVALAP